MFTKKIFKTLISSVICTAITLSSTTVFASVLGDSKIDGYTKQIGNGIYFTHNVFFSNQSGVGQQSENYFTYTPNGDVIPNITYGTSLFGAETLSAETSRLENFGTDILGGTNADFFSFQTGVPMSNAIIDGKIITKDASGQDAIGILEDGTAFMSYVFFNSVLIREDGSEVNIYNINKYRQPYAAYLMTEEFSETTRNTTRGYDIILGSIQGEMKLGTKLTAVVESVTLNDSAIPIPKGKMVLTVDEKAPAEFLEPLKSLRTGEKISINFSASGDARWNDVKVGMGSIGGKLLTNGQVNPNLEAGAAPRTAIGITKDGSIILYTIDGRQSGHSYGVQLKSLAERMKELGCIEALNFDGGGSTAITAQLPGNHYSTLKNSPSDGRERNVSTYFYFVNTAQPTKKPASLHLYPATNYVLTGADLQLTTMAIDSNFYPVSLSDEITYSVENGKNSTITQNGLFTAKDNGLVTVYANSGDISGSLGIICLETPTDLVMTDKATGKRIDSLNIIPGEKISLAVDAYGGYNKLISKDSCFTWDVDSAIGSLDSSHTFTASGEYGAKGNIRITAGNKTLTIPVTLAPEPGTADDPDSYPTIELEFKDGVLSGRISNKYFIPILKDGISLRVDGQAKDFEYGLITGNFTAELEPGVHKITVYATNYSGFTTFKTITVEELSGTAPFSDTSNHWAEDILSYMYSKKIINGDPTDGTLRFNPQKPMTRSEFAVMTVNYLGVNTDDYKNVKLPYSDIREIPNWALDSFKALYELGILKGRYVSDTESCADPLSSISRAEAATIVSRTLPTGIYKTKIKATDKKDVASWAEEGISVLMQIGAMKGYEDGSLKPNAPLTKAEAAKILYSAM